MQSTEASPRLRKPCAIRDLLLLVVLAVLLFGCDKKATRPEGGDKPVSVSSVYPDIEPPPPVVRIPDALRSYEDEAVDAGEDEGPGPGDVGTIELRGAISAQAAFVEDEVEKLEKVEKKAKEAQRLIKAKVESGRKDFDSWRKRHGSTIPTMKSLEDLEQKSFKRVKGKKTVYPQIFKGEGEG
jgi:hypothetical protein